jgi:F-type H+-transporting ATPase subunit b
MIKKATLRVFSVVFFVAIALGLLSREAQAAGGSSPASLIPIAVNFFIFLAIIYFATRNKVPAFLKSRKAKLEQEIQKANEAYEKARAEKEKFEKKLAQVKQEGDQVVEQAKTDAENMKKEILEEAERLKKQILRDTDKATRHEISKVRGQLREEVVALASQMAQELIHKQMTKEDQQRYLNDTISEIRQ